MHLFNSSFNTIIMIDYYLIELYSRRVLQHEQGINLCAFYVCEFIHMTTSEWHRDLKQLQERKQ